jgi:hypothetical protein
VTVVVGRGTAIVVVDLRIAGLEGGGFCWNPLLGCWRMFWLAARACAALAAIPRMSG